LIPLTCTIRAEGEYYISPITVDMAIYSLVRKQLRRGLHRIYVYGMLPWPVWTTVPSGCARKVLGENLAWKHLEHWNAAVGVDEGRNTTSANLTNHTEDLKRKFTEFRNHGIPARHF